jgi:hypothetical protein
MCVIQQERFHGDSHHGVVHAQSLLWIDLVLASLAHAKVCLVVGVHVCLYLSLWVWVWVCVCVCVSVCGCGCGCGCGGGQLELAPAFHNYDFHDNARLLGLHYEIVLTESTLDVEASVRAHATFPCVPVCVCVCGWVGGWVGVCVGGPGPQRGMLVRLGVTVSLFVCCM